MKDDLEARRVIVRIWTSEKNPVHPGKDVGHIAIEIPSIQTKNKQNLYISLWPSRGINMQQVTDTIPPRWHTVDDDLKAEGRKPEIIYCFYTLDRHAMQDRFVQIKETLQGWRLLGNLFIMEQDTAESCASLAYKILQAGDALAKILPSDIRQSSSLSSTGSSNSSATGSSNSSAAGSSNSSAAGSSKMFNSSVYSSELTCNSLAKNPDALAEVLKEAKLNEYKKRPETRDIVYPEETPVPTPKISGCLVM